MSLALFHQAAVDVSSALFHLPHRSSSASFRVLLLKRKNGFHFILTGYCVFSFNCIRLQCRRPCSEYYLRAYLVFLGVLQRPSVYRWVYQDTELGIVMRATQPTRLLPHISPGCLPYISPESINQSVSLSLTLSLSLSPSAPPLASPF